MKSETFTKMYSRLTALHTTVRKRLSIRIGIAAGTVLLIIGSLWILTGNFLSGGIEPAEAFLIEHLEPSPIEIPKAGLTIETPEPLGRTKVEIFKRDVSLSGKSSIKKVVGIHPARNHALQARLAFQYAEEDLNLTLLLFANSSNGLSEEKPQVPDFIRITLHKGFSIAY